MLQPFIRTASLEALTAQSPKGWLNPIALRKAKIVYNFGLSECNRVNLLMIEGSDPTSTEMPYTINWVSFSESISLHSY